MQIKQHATGQSKDQRRNRERIKKGYFKANKNANITPKLNGIQLLEGSSQ